LKRSRCSEGYEGGGGDNPFLIMDAGLFAIPLYFLVAYSSSACMDLDNNWTVVVVTHYCTGSTLASPHDYFTTHLHSFMNLDLLIDLPLDSHFSPES